MAAGICLAAAAVGVVLLILRLVNVLVILFLSVLIAATVARPVRALERRRVPPAIAIVLVYLVVLGTLGLLIVLVIPPLISQIAGVGRQLPELLDRYQELRRLYESLRQQYPELRPFEQEIGGLGGQLLSDIGTSLSRLPQRLFGLVFDVLSVMVISTLLVARRQELLRAVLDLTPPEHRERVRAVLTIIWVRLGQYLGAKLTVMLIVGALTYLALWLIGVPSPLLLAVIVALCEIIPRAGTWLARIPLFILAATAGWLALGLTIASSVAIQNLKGLVLSPFIEGSQLDLHPLLAFLSVLIGAALLGLAGAALAIPAAAAVQVIAEEIVLPWYRHRVVPAETQRGG